MEVLFDPSIIRQSLALVHEPEAVPLMPESVAQDLPGDFAEDLLSPRAQRERDPRLVAYSDGSGQFGVPAPETLAIVWLTDAT